MDLFHKPPQLQLPSFYVPDHLDDLLMSQYRPAPSLSFLPCKVDSRMYYLDFCPQVI